MSQEWTGVKYNDKNEPCCAGCGRENVPLDMVSHADFATYYSYVFHCMKCGHTISMTADRDPESMKWHDEPMEEA